MVCKSDGLGPFGEHPDDELHVFALDHLQFLVLRLYLLYLFAHVVVLKVDFGHLFVQFSEFKHNVEDSLDGFIERLKFRGVESHLGDLGQHLVVELNDRV